MSTVRTVGFMRRLFLGLAVVGLALAAVRHASAAPAVQGRVFDVYLDSTQVIKAWLQINEVSGSGPWNLKGTLQYGTQTPRPVTGKMTQESTGGFKISFSTARSFQTGWDEFDGAISTDSTAGLRPGDTPGIFMAGQYFKHSRPDTLDATGARRSGANAPATAPTSRRRIRIGGDVFGMNVTGPLPFCGRASGGGVILRGVPPPSRQ
jgi:hypothetical protein